MVKKIQCRVIEPCDEFVNHNANSHKNDFSQEKVYQQSGLAGLPAILITYNAANANKRVVIERIATAAVLNFLV